MTRIHKKPGSKAWEKSIKKSASRMARDSARAGEKGKVLLKKYLGSKTPKELKVLIEEGVLVGTAKKRAEKALRMWQEHKSLNEQMNVLVKGGDFNLKTMLKNVRTGRTKDTPKRLKRFRSTIVIGISSIQAYIENCKWLEKSLPKEQSRYLAKTRKDAQEILKKGQIILEKIDELIESWD